MMLECLRLPWTALCPEADDTRTLQREDDVVVILGSGAVALFLADAVARTGRDVYVCCRSRPTRKLLHKEGVTICDRTGGTRTSATCDGNIHFRSMDPGATPAARLLIVACKTHEFTSASLVDTTLHFCDPGTVVLTVFNGLLHVPTLVHAFGHRLVFGALDIVCRTYETTTVLVSACVAPTLRIGTWDGMDSLVAHHARLTVETALLSQRLHVNIVANTADVAWQKFVFVASLVATACPQKKGSLIDVMLDVTYRERLQNIIAECCHIAASEGCNVDAVQVFNKQMVFTKTQGTPSVSAQDDYLRDGTGEAVSYVRTLVLLGRKHTASIPLLEDALQRMIDRQVTSRSE